MNADDVIPFAPTPLGRPLLALDREELRLASPRGDAVSGGITLSNRGDGPLDGTVLPRRGDDWLHTDPAVLRLAPGASQRVEIRADPATLEPGYTMGEIAVLSSGGDAAVTVRIGVRTGRSWALFAGALAASIAVAALVAILLAGVKLPAAAPAAPAHVTSATTQRRHARTAHKPPVSFNRQAALADIRAAIERSNAVWQAALTNPSTADLGTVKTGPDLAATIADVEGLLSTGEHWRIALRSFDVLSVQVSADDAGGSGVVRKTEQRALLGPGHERTPYALSDDTYLLRYALVRRGGRWLVNNIAVQSITPHSQARGAALSVEQVATIVDPSVMHVEADLSDGTAVGTGIIVRSTADTTYVLTNDHVVTGATAVKLQRWIGNTYQPANPWVASKVWEDAANDLAVIRIDQGNLPAVTWGDSNALAPGQAVVAIGYAENLYGGPTVTDGIVSSLQRTLTGQPNGATYIGHSAIINHGNSGGPLADLNGRIVGINTWTLDNTQGLFFAIPSSRAIRVVAGFIGTNG